MKFKFALLLAALVFSVSFILSCSGGRENKDLYLLEELESVSGISNPEKRVERLGLYVDTHGSHPYRVPAYVKIVETIAGELNDFDRAMARFEEYLSKETEPSVRGELLYRKFAYLWNSDREKAVDFAEKLIEGGEKDYKLFLYLGYYLMDLEDKSELTVKTFEKAAGNTEDPVKRNHIVSVLAEFYEKSGKDTEAYETALKASEYPFANRIIGGYLWEKGERDKALEAYIRLAAGAPGYAHYVRLDSLYTLAYPGADDLGEKILQARLIDEGPVPDMEFTDIEGRSYSISGFKGTKLVISAWSPT